MNGLALATALGFFSVAQPTGPTTGPATGPTTRPDAETTLEQARQEVMAEQRAWVEDLPEAEPARLADLLGYKMENGFLILSLEQELERGRWRQPVEDLPDKVVSLSILGGGAPGSSKSVTLGIMGLGDGPSELSQSTEAVFGVLFGALQLAQDTTFAMPDGSEGIRNVSVVQLSAGTPEEPGVRLSVTGDDPGSPERVSLVFEAETFEDLMREEPLAFQQYVAPVLNDLGLRDLADEHTRAAARQLLLAGFSVPAEVEREVEELMLDLDAEDFATREAAEKALKALGLPAAAAVERLLEDEVAREDLTAEQALRLRNVLAEFKVFAPEALDALASDNRFWQRVKRLEGEPGDALLVERATTRAATRPTTGPGTPRVGQSR